MGRLAERRARPQTVDSAFHSIQQIHVTGISLDAWHISWSPSRYTGSVGIAKNELNRMERRFILGVDYGRSRIGLALADTETRMARPLSTIERINRNEDMRRLRELVRKHGVRQIVMGLPLRLDGTRGEMAEEAERFAQRVWKQIGVPVEMVDERLTSWEAERLLEEVQGRFIHEEKLGGSKKPKNIQAKMSVDAVAAAVILKEYLNRQEQTADKA
ncbi:MAG: Holliday junction resolvase RuvX [Acidobacteria bacterium]|nr:MAG: Holliday junction resolvase RuvX [Acidobacteriota bacterium]PYT62641.1 MAG: Holliday junction resolvase RuvX [Acidobacteriota bacterium]